VSGPCLSSSVAGRPLRPATRHCLGGPLPRQLADRPRAHPETLAFTNFDFGMMPSLVICGINPPFGGLSPISGQVAHVLLTLAPLTPRCIATPENPFDLHVLSTPPAFVLSQNQTLHKKFLLFGRIPFLTLYQKRSDHLISLAVLKVSSGCPVRTPQVTPPTGQLN
jgi:hypothetical protein